MRGVMGWLLGFFAVIFWIFNLVAAIMFSFEKSFMITPINEIYQIIWLFVTVIPMILIFKRKIFGAVIYLVANFAYFGYDAYNFIMKIVEGKSLIMSEYTSAFFTILGIILPVMVLMNVLLDKTKMSTGENKKTDWFYENEAFDREMDERADQNQYRT